MASKTYVFSIGGSLIAPGQIDTGLIKKYKKLFSDFTRRGNKVILIIGGGDTARTYQKAAKAVNESIAPLDLDWVGIAATRINAELIRAVFGRQAHDRVMEDPSKKVKTKKKILVGAGYQPGWSSDLDAVLAAQVSGAKKVVNLTNVDYVYDKNPKKFKNAKSFESLTWREFRKIVGYKWVPGQHAPFDPIASGKAQTFKLELVVMNGKNIHNLKKFLEGKNFIGTTIK